MLIKNNHVFYLLQETERPVIRVVIINRIKTEIRVRPSRTENLSLETAKTASIRTEIKTKAEVAIKEVLPVIDSGLTMAATPRTRPAFVMLVPMILPRARPGLRISEA